MSTRLYSLALGPDGGLQAVAAGGQAAHVLRLLQYLAWNRLVVPYSRMSNPESQVGGDSRKHGRTWPCRSRGAQHI